MNTKIWTIVQTPRLWGVVGLFLAVLAAGVPGIAHGEDASAVKKQIKSLEKNLNKERKDLKYLERRAGKLENLIEGNKVALIEAAKQKQQSERRLTVLENQLAELEVEQETVRTHLAAQSSLSHTTIAQLIQASRQSPLTLLALPESPLKTAQRLSVMRQIVPQAQKKMASLQEQLTALAEIEEEIHTRKERIITRKVRLDQDEEWLSYLVEKRKKTFSKVAGTREKKLKNVAKLAAKSRNFHDLLNKLDEGREVTQATPSRKPNRTQLAARTPEAGQKTRRKGGKLMRGALVMPASGKVLERYGQRTDAGGTAKGMKIRTRAGATVVSPYDGEVVYAAPFRGYGNLVIIEHDSGYHTLLSGLQNLDTEVGQWLLSGEPIGTMSQNHHNKNGGRKNTLYIEFRKRGAPINITPWIAQREDKGSG